jgi:hypothetical protein
VQDTSLAGVTVKLPDAVRGKIAVLVVGFSRASQGQLAAWGKRLATDYSQTNSVAYFQMPMLGGAPKVLRGMILKSMTKSIPVNERAHYLPVLEDDQPWRTITRYNKSMGDDAYVLLVDGDGVVRWQAVGGVTTEAYAALARELQKLHPLASAH